jgi:hypothetical protein
VRCNWHGLQTLLRLRWALLLCNVSRYYA